MRAVRYVSESNRVVIDDVHNTVICVPPGFAFSTVATRAESEMRRVVVRLPWWQRWLPRHR